ncbi:MAG: aldo/keto reductase [Anaerolineales bacterium]|uniref:aldo/keto reductase n=1 Tax=Candidatus Villigracilis affinis TaxID=3140682 RepID=UPI001E0F355F|nr:aldo/keto reductase [Anaerolineales bacterium]MBK9602661.1 aldo/keto reductase [Anaerolineales bacterium]MBL0345827.1 aldo/keto reductase [Anaerolineales bacterium]
MEYRRLGCSGVLVSPLCLGTLNFGGATTEKDSFEIMRRAVDGGINFFDTANVYYMGEGERIVGRFLKEHRLHDQVFLATKVFHRMGDLPNDGGATRYHIIKACEDSLQRLQTDHVDLYQLHRPPLAHSQEEALRAFDDLIRAGKVRYIGCSTHPAWMVMESLSISEKAGLNRYISEQPPYNLLDRRIENELVPLCRKYDLAIVPYSPLAVGVLAGRYPQTGNYPEGSRAQLWDKSMSDSRITQRGIDVANAVGKMAEERGLTSSQLALLWTKDQPGITAPIIGPRTLAHLEDALVVMDKTLDEADRPLFDELVHPGNAVSDFHNNNEWMKARVNS